MSIEITNNQKDCVKTKHDMQIISFVSQNQFESWMEENNSFTEGIWVRFYKKNSFVISMNYQEALDVALCYGWIDGQVKKHDDLSYIQKFTPRRTKSMWSKRNKEHVMRLLKENRMKPPGLTEVENAKKDGRWERAYDSPGNMTVPEDFILKLSTNKKAFEFFESINKTNKYTIGWRLQTAPSQEIREKRMNEILLMMEKGEKFH